MLRDIQEENSYQGFLSQNDPLPSSKLPSSNTLLLPDLSWTPSLNYLLTKLRISQLYKPRLELSKVVK